MPHPARPATVPIGPDLVWSRTPRLWSRFPCP